jgi:hypothetical protein
MDKETWILLIYLLHVILNGVEEGIRILNKIKYDDLRTDVFFYLRTAGIVTLLGLALIYISKDEFLWYVLSYACIRFGLFELVINITIGHHLFTINMLTSWNRLLLEVFNNVPKRVLFYIIKALAFAFGVTIIWYI